LTAGLGFDVLCNDLRHVPKKEANERRMNINA
jgi:hypothetical protein